MLKAADIPTLEAWIDFMEIGCSSIEEAEACAKMIHVCKLRIEELRHKELFTKNVTIIR